MLSDAAPKLIAGLLTLLLSIAGYIAVENRVRLDRLEHVAKSADSWREKVADHETRLREIERGEVGSRARR